MARPVLVSGLAMALAAGALGCRSEGPLEPSPCDGMDSDAIIRLCIDADPGDLAWLEGNASVPDLEIDVTATVAGIATPAELEIHGGTARLFEKLSYRILFEEPGAVPMDWFGDGVESVDHLVLQASWIDRSFARAKLAMDLTRQEGGLAPRIAHVQVFINGEWHGLYLAIERIEARYFERHDLNPIADVYKASFHAANWETREDEPLRGFELTQGSETTAASELLEFFTALEDTPTTDEAYDEEVASRLNIADWVAWHIVMTFVQNRDTFTKNYYLHHDPLALESSEEDRYRIIQWDADATFGNEWTGTPVAFDDPLDWYGWRNVEAPRYFAVPGYRSDYLDQYEDALESRLTPEDLEDRLDEFSDRIRSFAELDLERWQPEYDFDDEIDRLRGYFVDRHAAMVEVVEGVSED